MKNKMLKNIKTIASYTLALLVVVSSFGFGFIPVAQADVVPTVTIGSQSALNGTSISVPISATNFANTVAGMDFSVRYDSTLLTYTGLTQNAISGHGALTVGTNTNTININWFDASAALNIDSGTILTLNFTVTSASITNTNLTFTGSGTIPADLVDAIGDPISSTSFVPGTITLNPASTVATVTSGSYSVSAEGTSTETITNVPFGTSKTTFLAALTKGESHQTLVDTGISNPVVTGNTLVVTAQDGTTVVTYTVTVVSNPESSLKISTNSANPSASNIMVSDTSSTNDVVMNKFNIKATGSNITLNKISLILTGTGATPAEIASQIKIKVGGDLIAINDSVLGINGTYEFTLDSVLTIPVDTVTTFSVYADINHLGGNFTQGDSLKMDYANVTAVDAYDTPVTSITGSAIGSVQTFYSEGISVNLVNTSTVVTTGESGVISDSGTFTINFNVTAFGGDMWIDKTAPSTTGGENESDINITGDGTTESIITSNNAFVGVDGFRVEDGTTKSFTVTTVISPTASGLFNVKLADLLYALTDINGNLHYTGLDGFETSSIYLNAVQISSAKDITSFSFAQGAGVITGTNIAVTAPFSTVVTALVPTIVISGGTVSPLSGVAQDFTNPVTYTVTAEDASTKIYTVTVTVATPADISALTTAKATAQGLIDTHATESTTPGNHIIGSLTTLSTALSATNATEASAQSVVNGQVSTLNSAISAYNLAIVPLSSMTAYDATLASKVQANYTIVTWDAYQIVVLANVVTNHNTQEEVDAATANITVAQSSLIAKAGLEAYTAALAIVHEVDYTTASWTIYQGIVNANVVTDQDTQEAVTLATSNITAAQINLVAIAVMTAYNTALSAVTEADYTSASWATYQGVVGANVVTNQDLQSAVDTATVNIVAAQGSLATVAEAEAVVLLNTAKGNAGALTQGNYTVASWATLTTALNLSETTTTQIVAKTTAINNAISNLILSIGGETSSLTPVSNEDGTVSGTITGASEATTVASGVTVTVNIPAETTITGPTGWDGTINLPTVTTSFTLTPDSGNTASAVSAIEVGLGDTPLTLDKAVKFTFTGLAVKLVGWSQAGVFHQITSTCNSATDPTLDAGADCKIDVGSDLVVWTKHFTSFVAYTQTTNNTNNGGGGGGGGGSSYVPPVVTTTVPVVPITPTAIEGCDNRTTGFSATTGQSCVGNSGSNSTVISGCDSRTTGFSTTTGQSCVGNTGTTGQVLGAEHFNFTQLMKNGSKGNEVMELQNFLNSAGYSVGTADGKFGAKTKAALIKFQTATKLKGDGVVGPKVRALLNA